MSEQIIDLPCAFCDGTGIEPETVRQPTWEVSAWRHGVNCSLCGGKGLIRLTFDDTPTPTCGPCGGTGRSIAWDYDICTILGDGSVDCPPRPCEHCQGFGRRSMTGNVTQIA